MRNLRDQACGRDCQIRLPGCRFLPEYTVLAHFRLGGVDGGNGAGRKNLDVLGAWACDTCHAKVDTDKSPETQLAFAHGVFRTQATLHREGILRW